MSAQMGIAQALGVERVAQMGMVPGLAGVRAEAEVPGETPGMRRCLLRFSDPLPLVLKLAGLLHGGGGGSEA